MYPENVLWVCNARNGLVYRERLNTPHIGYFLSTHAHRSNYYFTAHAMPLAAMAHLLEGNIVAVVDASKNKMFPDALVTGVGSWIYAFNRALRIRDESLVPYGTRHMMKYAFYSREAKKVKKTVRRLASILNHAGGARGYLYRPNINEWRFNSRSISLKFPNIGPAVVSVSLEKATWDDKPEVMLQMLQID